MLIQSLITRSGKEKIILNGMEKERISPEGIDLIYGLLIQKHIIEQNFYIEIDQNNQPIIRDNESPERVKKIA